jgi:hypothetical protein
MRAVIGPSFRRWDVLAGDADGRQEDDEISRYGRDEIVVVLTEP